MKLKFKKWNAEKQSIAICVNDVTGIVKGAVKPKSITIPKLQFEVYLEMDAANYKLVEKDDRVANDVFDEVSKLYKVCVADLIESARALDEQALSDPAGARAAVKAWPAVAERQLTEAGTSMKGAAEKAIAARAKENKAFKKFRFKTVMRISVGTVGVAVATLGSVVAVPGTGPGAIAAVYGNVKALAALLTEIREAAKSFERAESDLKDSISKIETQYRQGCKASNTAYEVGKMVASAFALVPTNSLGDAQRALEQFEGKLVALTNVAAKGQKKIETLVEREKALSEALAEAEKVALTKVGKSSAKALSRVVNKQFDVQKKTAAALQTLKRLYEKIKIAKEHEDHYQKTLLELNKLVKGSVVAVTGLLIPIPEIALAAGLFTDWSSVVQAMIIADTIGVEVDSALLEAI